MEKTIIFVADSLGSGGAQQVMLRSARLFDSSGYKVYIIAVKNHCRLMIPESINVIYLNFKKGFGIYRWLTDFYYHQKLIKIIQSIEQQNNVAAIFVHQMFSSFLLGNPKFKMPIFHTVHINYSEGYLNRKKSGRRLKKLRTLYNQKNILTVSQGIENDLIDNLKVTPRFIQTIYNPFDFQKIRELSSNPIAFKSEPFLLTVGRFSKQKRHDILLKAYWSANTPLPLVIIGDGSINEKNNLEAMVETLGLTEKVFIVGFKENPYSWMKRAKLFILSSDFEGLPTVLIESLICGTPAISTNCPSGPSEILVSTPEALSPVGDVENLSCNIIKFSQNPPEISQTDLDRFKSEAILKQYESCIASCSF
ncbi:glycosyltransferase [uncultured Desulfobacter sp.]|uniref:glycosyltransferase n=1 Tax=uncultured Desulfobacter sp. TaxID=240139 RepID=UPI002AAB73F5|nr:glycosyltransferase [uncultured Desulfobacter sp.]